MADPLGEVMGALVTVLDADPTLITLEVDGWYEVFAPAGTALPFGLLRFLSGGDSNTSRRRELRLRLLVIGVGSTPEQARQVCAAMDEALRNAALTVSGWSVYRCLPDDEYVMPDLFEGKQVYQRGKIFGIWLDEN